MRKNYTKVLKSYFHQKLFRSRVDLGITQEEMAHRLLMASRTYIDLDHGKTCCSALTLALFLIYIYDDPCARIGRSFTPRVCATARRIFG